MLTNENFSWLYMYILLGRFCFMMCNMATCVQHDIYEIDKTCFVEVMAGSSLGCVGVWNAEMCP